jgi:hypothetical protein
MSIQDSVFGFLDYDNFWYKDITVSFFDRTAEISLTISGEENGIFDDGQYTAFTVFMQYWGRIQARLLQAILEYYLEKRHELGYDIEVNEGYPLIETTDQLLDHITIVGVDVPYADIFEGRAIGITFDCTWDNENGVGLRLINEKIVDVGYQDVAM